MTDDVPGSRGRDRQSEIFRAGSFGHRPRVPTGWAELERRAGRTMSRTAFAYVAGSAGLESTASANRRAFDRWRIVPRGLVDVRRRDLTVELFGRRLPVPLLLAPIGVLEMAHQEAERAVGRAATQAGVPLVVSTQASVPMEEVARAMGSGPRWFQLYASAVDELSDSFVRRAEDSGYEAVVLTVDTTQLGWRPRDLDLGYLPFAHGLGIAQYTSDPVFGRLVDERLANADSVPVVPPDTRGGARRRQQRPTPAAIRTLVDIARAHPGGSVDNLRSDRPRAAVETFLDVFPRPQLSWDDLARLREVTSLPLLLKGILHPDDAARAVRIGVEGIVVSNHGGRQVDGAVGALDALPAVVAAVAAQDAAVPVLFDSGVRCGADVVKALCLGARAVLVGRPYVYGLALDGEPGVRAVIDNLAADLDLTVALMGATGIADLTADRLQPDPPTG